MVLDLRPVSRKLDELHQRFIDEGLPPELARDAFAGFDPVRYRESELARGRAAWSTRVLDTQRSLIFAARFLADLAEMGTSGDIQGLAARWVRDRQRHVELARRMVLCVGGTNEIAGRLDIPVRPTRKVRMRVLHAMVGHLCVESTIEMRVMSEMAKQTEDPMAKSIIQFTAGDVAIHSRLGWLMCEVVVPALTDRERRDVVEKLPEAFAEAEVRFLTGRVPAGTARTGPTHPFGSMDAAHRQQVFDGAMDTCVARLEQLRLPARRALPPR